MDYIKSSYYFDYHEKSIHRIAAPYIESHLPKNEVATSLYLQVRDGWRYDPYSISLEKEHYRASHIAEKSSGNCVEKSILLIACLRALGIPARLHLGKVRNHIAVERLMEKFGSNELTPHGMLNVFLNDRWLKASPAFNKELCSKFHVKPLEFDGLSSSYLQQYNSDGDRFMEYIEDYGHFDDVPVDFMIRNIKEHYPHIFDTGSGITQFQL